MLMLSLIHDFRNRFPDIGYYEKWHVRTLRNFVGISYQDVYRLERLRIVTPIRRNESGRLEWSREELQKFLEEVERFLETRELGMSWLGYALQKNTREVVQC